MTRALTTLHGSPMCTITGSSSSTSSKPNRSCNVPCLGNNVHNTTSSSCQHTKVDASNSISPVSRRDVVGLGIVGGAIALGINGGGEEKNAWGAARRPPPPPPGEKKDPNVSGVLAKVLASKKRKEAMKEAMAKQRERGNKVEE